MITMTLSASERQQLEATFTTTADRRLRTRCQAILMAARGRRRQNIAEDLAVSPRTLQRWLNTYRRGGLDALRIRWAPGRNASIPETLAPEIVRWVQQGPAGCGLDRANWTYGALTVYLYQRTGIAVSETTMRTCCTKHGIRPYRPTYQYLKGHPQAQATARQDLATFKKNGSRRTRLPESGRGAFFDDSDAPHHAKYTSPLKRG